MNNAHSARVRIASESRRRPALYPNERPTAPALRNIAFTSLAPIECARIAPLARRFILTVHRTVNDVTVDVASPSSIRKTRSGNSIKIIAHCDRNISRTMPINFLRPPPPPTPFRPFPCDSPTAGSLIIVTLEAKTLIRRVASQKSDLENSYVTPTG